MAISLEQIQQELEKKESPGKNLIKNTGILLISLMFFISLGLLNNSFSGIIILVIVIFIHESGHFIGMRLFRYKDIQMFFIPLFGAAVAGEETNPSGAKKAFVSFLGPAPGIFLGIICGIFYIITREEILIIWTRTFLFINIFNLLPFYPLDGGRFFDYILFSRKPKIELFFKIITGICLGLIALLLKFPLLGIFAFFILLSLPVEYQMAKISHVLKKDIQPGIKYSLSQIPSEILDKIVNFLNAKIPEKQKRIPLFITYTKDIWRRIHNTAPGIASTIGLFLLYSFVMISSLSAIFLFETSLLFDKPRTELIRQLSDDNKPVWVENQYVFDAKYSTVPLNSQGAYHGTQIFWDTLSDTGTKIKEGEWNNGYKHGEWKFWDKNNRLSEIIYYDMGKPVRYARITDGIKQDIPPSKWPYYVRTQKKQEISDKFIITAVKEEKK